MPAAAEFQHQRFTLLEELGAGGMGTVFRARDRERGEDVALKVLSRATPLGIYRFKQEFRALAGLSHPNLLALYELLSTGTQWFFTAELLDGTDLARHVLGADAPSRPPGSAAAETTGSLPRRVVTGALAAPPARTEATTRVTAPASTAALIASPPRHAPVVAGEALERLRTCFRQLAVGLHALHRSGHLHRDIKPSNVLVTRAGRVVVVDFGVLVTLASDDPFEEVVEGTPAYMAPEQAAGAALDERCDWYAVGVMLFELLTGRRPFGGHGEALLHQRAHFAAPRVRELSPDAPAELAALADALLARDPAGRPSGREVLAALGGAPEAGARGGVGGAPAKIPLVGRTRELEHLRAALAAVPEGSVHAALVAGPSGIGKSALCEAFLEEAERAGALVVSGRCHERESVPFKAIDGLIDALAVQLGRLSGARQEALAGDRALLARQFPVLRPDFAEPVEAAGGPIDPAERKRLVAPALHRLLAGLADGRPLVLHLDDVQWGDADSAMLLAEALAPPWSGRVLLVLGARDEELRGEFLRLLSRWLFVPEPLVLAPLGGEATLELARELLGAAAANEEVARLARAAAGIPFYVAELAQRGEASVPASGDDGLERTALDSLLLRRIRSLTDQARALLETLAVAGRPLAANLAARVAHLPGAEQNLLVQLRNHRLVRLRRSGRGETLEAFHDRVREVVAASLSPEKVSGIHRRLADAILASGAIDAEALATHLEGAGDPAAAQPYAVRAGDEAARVLAFERAAAWYGRALALGRVEPAEALALLVRQAEALAYANRGREAADAYQRAAALSSGVDAMRLRLSAADQLLRAGYLGEGRGLLYDVLAQLGERPRRFDVTGLVPFLARRAYIHLRGFDFEPVAEHEIPALELLHIDALASAGESFGYHNPFQGTDFLSRSLARALDAGEPLRVVRAITRDAYAYAVDDHPLGTRAWRRRLREAERLHQVIDDPASIALRLSAEAMGWFQRAEFARVPELAHRSTELVRLRAVGLAWNVLVTEVLRIWALDYLGRLREAAAASERVAREARERGDVFHALSVDSGLPILRFLAADRPERADEAQRENEARVAQLIESPQPHWHVLVGEVLTALYVDDPARARAMLARTGPLVRKSELFVVPGVRVELAWMEASVLLASPELRRGERDARRRAERWLRRLARDRSPLGAPMAAAGSATLAALAGDLDTAARRLRDAADGYRRLGCVLHAAAVDLRLAATLGGSAGDELRRTALATFAAEDVRAPERLARVLASGPV